MTSQVRMFTAASLCLLVAFAANAQRQPDTTTFIDGTLTVPDGFMLPRAATPAEKAFANMIRPLRLAAPPTSPPLGPVFCPPEYAPTETILIRWAATTSTVTPISIAGEWTKIQREMIKHITTTGNANVVVFCVNSAGRTNANSQLNAVGADMSRVTLTIRNTDSIWIRDYGPRYIFEGDVRAIVDHTYNVPRPNDNALPAFHATNTKKPLYDIGLDHGGGNYHLSGLTDAYATKLITNENPSLSEAQIIGRWLAFQNLDTHLFNPFSTIVDGTQHIDMWLQILDDRVAVVSQWPFKTHPLHTMSNNYNSLVQAASDICDAAAIYLANLGYTVIRTPARMATDSFGDTSHYTYTNMVVCNDLILLPFYNDSALPTEFTASGGYNDQALAAIQSAFPAKTIVQIDCDELVWASGVMHCIVKHVPVHRGATTPTAYLQQPAGPVTIPGATTGTVRWISDDDVSVTRVDLHLSTDDGATYNRTIAQLQPANGSANWPVPNVYTNRARIRVRAYDAPGNIGVYESPVSFTINGLPLLGDLDLDVRVNLNDIDVFLPLFGQTGPGLLADLIADDTVNAADFALQLAQLGQFR